MKTKLIEHKRRWAGKYKQNKKLNIVVCLLVYEIQK